VPSEIVRFVIEFREVIGDLKDKFWTCKSWRITIDLQREEIQELLVDNPSLKPYVEEAIARSYKQEIALVVKETPFDKKDLPSICPYNTVQILNQDFYPN
jgi:hypothetical protein